MVTVVVMHSADVLNLMDNNNDFIVHLQNERDVMDVVCDDADWNE